MSILKKSSSKTKAPQAVNFSAREILTKLPGMENIKVYSSSPMMIREGSSKAEESILQLDVEGYSLD